MMPRPKAWSTLAAQMPADGTPDNRIRDATIDRLKALEADAKVVGRDWEMQGNSVVLILWLEGEVVHRAGYSAIKVT